MPRTPIPDACGFLCVVLRRHRHRSSLERGVYTSRATLFSLPVLLPVTVRYHAAGANSGRASSSEPAVLGAICGVSSPGGGGVRSRTTERRAEAPRLRRRSAVY
ncbi:hypothetical protein MTO96_001348 [Rhipicephalus appendiculatus]